MNERVLVLRDAVVKITQMLSGQGIQVTQRGISAYVKSDREGRPIQVNLPYLPDNATEELCMAIQGFLDHEVAHILFTDFALMNTAGNQSLHQMVNALEDPRIEKCMARKFAGSAHNLSVTGKFFLDKYTVPMMKEAAAEGDASKVIGILMVPLIRAMSGQFIFKEFMRDKMHIVQVVYDKIADLEPKIEAASSTRDCIELAKEIEARLRDKSEGKKGKSKGGSKEKGDSKKGEVKSSKTPTGKPEDEDKPSKPESEKEDEGDGEDEEKEKPESEEPEPEAEPDETKPEADDEDKSEPSEKETPDAEEGEEEAGGEEGEALGRDSDGGDDGAGDDDEEGDLAESTAAIWEAIDKNSFDASMSELISNAASDAAKESPYLIYTKEMDRVEPLRVGKKYESNMLADLADNVDHMVGPLQKDLERAIAARSLATWESGKRSGRLHAANLSRLATGDGRVFRKRHETTSKDVAVSLVIDCSGSMDGEKIHLATQSAYALTQVLERIGINHEVIAFTTGALVADRGVLDAETSKIGRNFTRIESLYMPVLKGFNERLKTETRERFGWLPNSSILSNNVDGECVEIAARRLLCRRESGKVMIVLSDGHPCARGDAAAMRAHLKKVVADVEKAGVRVVGIGIQSKDVTDFYPKNTVINNVSELPDRVIKELRHLLVR
ncbi:MAG: hypothetical protein FWF12_00015 [Betaproteobacteria bacterium]|nr:hypothetical protein [Betaproteobacteria bacterium]